MDVYVVRHADAGGPDPKKYPDDRLRPLSLDGKAEMLVIARGMRRLGFDIDQIIDSGYVRARQTSECICDAYELDPAQIRTMDELAPEADPSATAAALRKLRGLSRLALVGHLPHLSRFVGHMVAKDDDLRIAFKKSGVCWIDVDRWSAGSASLEALLPPKALRKLGK